MNYSLFSAIFFVFLVGSCKRELFVRDTKMFNGSSVEEVKESMVDSFRLQSADKFRVRLGRALSVCNISFADYYSRLMGKRAPVLGSLSGYRARMLDIYRKKFDGDPGDECLKYLRDMLIYDGFYRTYTKVYPEIRSIHLDLNIISHDDPVAFHYSILQREDDDEIREATDIEVISDLFLVSYDTMSNIVAGNASLVKSILLNNSIRIFNMLHEVGLFHKIRDLVMGDEEGLKELVVGLNKRIVKISQEYDKKREELEERMRLNESEDWSASYDKKREEVEEVKEEDMLLDESEDWNLSSASVDLAKPSSINFNSGVISAAVIDNPLIIAIKLIGAKWVDLNGSIFNVVGKTFIKNITSKPIFYEFPSVSFSLVEGECDSSSSVWSRESISVERAVANFGSYSDEVHSIIVANIPKARLTEGENEYLAEIAAQISEAERISSTSANYVKCFIKDEFTISSIDRIIEEITERKISEYSSEYLVQYPSFPLIVDYYKGKNLSKKEKSDEFLKAYFVYSNNVERIKSEVITSYFFPNLIDSDAHAEELINKLTKSDTNLEDRRAILAQLDYSSNVLKDSIKYGKKLSADRSIGYDDEYVLERDEDELVSLTSADKIRVYTQILRRRSSIMELNSLLKVRRKKEGLYSQGDTRC